MDHGFESIRVKLASLIALGAFTGVPMIPASDPAAAQTPPAGSFVGSSRQADCAAACLNIVGRINKVGVDLGWEKGGTLIWDVRSPALASGPGALSGNYIGASADVVAGSVLVPMHWSAAKGGAESDQRERRYRNQSRRRHRRS